jgi:signal transduction histidine kinase
MHPDERIVIGPDGLVLAAADPALLDTRLGTCDRLAPEVRQAGRHLAQQVRGAPGRVVSQDVVLEGGRRVQIVAIEACAVRRRATDVRALLASKLAVISSQALAAHVTLTVGVADDVPPIVHLDAEKVAWAVTTLVGSALRYVHAGARRTGGRIDVRITIDPAGPDLVIEVQDDGPGIPADSVERLFRRNGLNARGTGLALLVMSDVCAAHGGRIDVRSSTDPSGHGTTVRLTFPVS